MRFSSNAPTTPTTTTSIDVIEVNLSGKRGSTTVASHEQPIQVVEMNLNGSTPTIQSNGDDSMPKMIPSVDKMQEIMSASNEYTESPPLNDDDGNV